MTRLLRLVIVASVAAAGVGCDAAKYTGDGRLSDAGPLAAHDRYVLDLGPINLSEPSESVYAMSGLPETELTVGFEIASDVTGPQPMYDAKPVNAPVALELKNERGETVTSVTAPLSSWTWSGTVGDKRRAFVYRRGEVRELARQGSATSYENIGVAADSGWGTYFRPRSNGHYTLRVTILANDPSASRVLARVQAVGGGWK